jgi:hypothetical protein
MRFRGDFLLILALGACNDKAGPKDESVAGHQDHGAAGRTSAGSGGTLEGSAGEGGATGQYEGGAAGSEDPSSSDAGSAGRQEGGTGGLSIGGSSGSGGTLVGEPTGHYLNLLLDPGFQGTPANAWSLSEHATIEPTAITTGVDPGQLRIDFCYNEGRFEASQQFDAPSFSVAGPSAIVARWRAGQGSSGLKVAIGGRDSPVKDGGLAGDIPGAGGSGGVEAVAGFGGAPSYAWHTQHICLGEKGYGPAVQLAFGFYRRSTCWHENYALIDRVDFVSDYSSCPAIGYVMNGDFEKTNGWDGLDLLPSGGPNGTRAARISNGTLRGSMSVPLASSLPNPSLRMKVKGTAGSSLNVSAGARPARVTGTGQFESLGLCLSQDDVGMVSDLSFSAEGSDFIIDDLTLDSDPQCAGMQLIPNGGFESVSSISTWFIATSPAATAQIESAGAAHSGSSHLHLSVTDHCMGPAATTAAALPSFASDAGPALRFFYRRPGPTANVQYRVVSFYASTLLPPTETWTEKIICLPTTPPNGLPFGPGTVSFQIASGGTCGTPYPAEDLFVDDVSVTTDPSCPTQ